jgi:ATP-dependent DNA helicase PIF1
MGKDIRSFPLSDIDHSYDDASHIPREIFEEASVEQNPEDVLLCDSLNAEQRSTYDEIMAAVYSKQGELFFVDGPGGTGKTFLYRALLAKLCSQDKLAMAKATFGVAAAIMSGRRTAHSCFKIPLTLQEGSCCCFTKQSGTAKLLQQAALIIWDETSMTKRQNVEALDNNLRDIMGPVTPTVWWEDYYPWWGFQTSPPCCAERI